MQHTRSLIRAPMATASEAPPTSAPEQPPEVLDTPDKTLKKLIETIAAEVDSHDWALPVSPYELGTRIATPLHQSLASDPSCLDLGGYDRGIIDWMDASMKEKAWQQLQAHAKSLQRQHDEADRGITSVVLPDAIPGAKLRNWVRGLQALDNLSHLQFAIPKGTKPTDLRRLAPREGHELQVSVRLPVPHPPAPGRPRRVHAIWVCKGTQVTAAAIPPQARLDKFIVGTCDHPDAHPSKTARLGSILHHPHPVTGMDPSKNLNGKGTLAAPQEDMDPRVMCRHLAVAFLLERQAYLHSKRESPRGDPGAIPHFSFEKFASAESITQSLPPDVETLCEKAAAPENLLSISTLEEFPAALVHQFESMKAGSVRHIYLTTKNHSMALELQAKAGAGGTLRAYTARLYDPNRTVTAPRIDFDALEKINRQSVAPLLAVIGNSLYHRGPGLPSVCLYGMNPQGSDGAGCAPAALHGIGPDNFLSLADLHRLAPALAPELILNTFRQILSSHDTLRERVNRLDPVSTHLGSNPISSSAFLRWLLSDDAGLTAHERGRVLFELRFRDAVRFAAKDPASIASLTRLIAGAAVEQLPSDDRWQLLADHDYGPLQIESRFVQGRYQAQPERLESTFAAAHEIALSKTLSPLEKAMLIAGQDQLATEQGLLEQLKFKSLAVRATEAGDTDLALALAAAVLDARLAPPETKAVLEGLGISLSKLLKTKLEQSPGPQIGGWLARAMKAATQSTWPHTYWEQAESIAIKKKFSFDTSDAIGARSDGKALRQNEAHLSRRWEGIQLSPMVRDTNPAFMVCSSPDVPERVRSHLVDPGSRPALRGLTVPAGQLLLLVPTAELPRRPLPSPTSTAPASALAPSSRRVDELRQANGLQVTGPGMPTPQECRAAGLRFVSAPVAVGGMVTHIACRANTVLPGLEGWQNSLLPAPGAAIDYTIPIERLAPAQ